MVSKKDKNGQMYVNLPRLKDWRGPGLKKTISDLWSVNFSVILSLEYILAKRGLIVNNYYKTVTKL